MYLLFTVQQIACLCEDLSLWVTQGGAVRMDGVAQKGNSAGGCDVVARAPRAEEGSRVVPEGPGAQRKVEGVTGNGRCWSGKNVEKSWRSWMECQGVAAGRGWSQSTRKSQMGG